MRKLIILISVFFSYLPFFVNPALLLNRENDLTGFFWPIIYYVKNSIFTHHQIPLWNNLFFAGTPLLADPQNPIWYLPNIIFLLLPIDTAFMITFILHAVFAGISADFLGKAFGFSKIPSLFIACLFILSPKLAGYQEAGHYGLIISFYWIPFLLLSLIKLVKTPKLIWMVGFAVSFAALYTNHILIATILAIGTIPTYFLLIATNKKNLSKTIKFSIITTLLTATLISPIVIPQLQWQPQTTRDMLLKYPDTYPKWSGKEEFIKYLFSSLAISPKDLDTEKLITIGIIPLLLSAIGFFYLKRKYKVALLATSATVLLVSLNNTSPIYSYLINQNWFILMRVATRVFILILVPTILLTGLGLEKIIHKHKLLAQLLFLITIVESLLNNYHIISKPINFNSNLAPIQVYEYLKSDKDIFKVFCTTRCLSQKESAIYGLHLADGYGTLQQKNYFQAAMQIGQYYSDRYTLSIPPFEIYLYNKLQPHAPTLTQYNIKYVISPHKLTDKNLQIASSEDNFTIYKNQLWKSPNYTVYTPNFIRIQVANQTTLIIPEIYSENWHAYQNGNDTTKVSESKYKTITVTIKPNTNFVDLEYEPFH